jgi:S-adenosylmethionine synthetase
MLDNFEYFLQFVTETSMRITHKFDLNVHPNNQPMEIVERKGIGHPDTLADGIAELASIRYSEYCLTRFGFVLHHNLDKVGVFGGRARFEWNSGTFDRPLRIVFGGRASTKFGSQNIPLAEILEAAALEQLKHALPGFDKVSLEFIHLTTDSSMYERWFKPETESDLPERRMICSNDTAFLTAVYPRSKAEDIALIVEAFFIRHEWAGTDIKVLVARTADHFDITCNVPVLAGTVHDYNSYRDVMSEAKQQIVELLRNNIATDLTLRLRALEDTPEHKIASPQDCYMNVSGSAIDYGEDGLVGRGNGRHGLISPSYGAGNETLFGKNPAYQVGKVGALIADILAEQSASVGGGAARIQLAYRRGFQYHDPLFCIVTTVREIDNLHKDKITLCTDPTEWIRVCVTEQRYRPKAPILAKLISGNTK